MPSYYAAWLIGYAYPYIKRDVTEYTIVKLETAAMALRNNPIVATDDSALPVRMDVSDLTRLTEYDNSKADVIAQILEGN
jgi:hypothetical protein